MTDLFWGAARIPAAFRILLARRELWIWCMLPLLINLALFAAALAVFFANYDAILAAIQQPLAVADPSAWYQWLWVGPLRLLSWSLQWLLIAVLLALIYLLFAVVGGVIAAPFLDVISQKVELLQTGQVYQQDGGVLRNSLNVAWQEAKRAALFLVLQVGVVVLGLIPGLQLPALLLAFLLATAFLSLDYTAYVLDRRGASFRERRAWFQRHRLPLLGFGAASLVSFAIPGVNFLCLPLLVTAGTQLALELPD